MPTHSPILRTLRKALSPVLAGALALALTAGMGFTASAAHAQDGLISIAEAERIALEHVPGGTIEEIERDRERGVIVYEVEVRAPNGVEHELVIDARTGRILRAEIDD